VLRKFLFLGLLATLALAGNAFAQTGNASLGGIVQDPTQALIPGVTVTATNVATNVTVAQLTNESGSYDFPVLQPGTYKVTAELQGFKKAVHENIVLGYATQVRENFTLEVGSTQQTVDVVSTSAEALKSSSASIGDVITQQQIDGLPMVGNNVLTLLNVLPGLNLDPRGDTFDTINGLGFDSLNVTRDGLSIVNTRFDTQYNLNAPGLNTFTNPGRNVLSSTTLLPDLVGEIRLILSPADAELGRGNSQMQISTRSGTNRYAGSATWDVRNSALDANTWLNNHTLLNGKTTPANWYNNNQYTVAYGGPVQIPGLYNGKGKTFFYALWDQNIHRTKDQVNANVLTDTAREGIFRYWTGYTPVGWNANSTAVAQTLANFPLNTGTATWVAVDQNGNPVAPPYDPTSTAANPIPYSGHLVCFSVFGNQRLDPANGFAMAPFTPTDCQGGTAVLGSNASSGTLWDTKRTTFDSTGIIAKQLTLMPHANYWGANDGLNIAQYRWSRGHSGDNSNANSFVTQYGTNPLNVNSKQINIKVDHNFTSKHKVAVSYSYQHDDSVSSVGNWPNSLPGSSVHRPYLVTVNMTSTISARMINEARFGVNHDSNQTLPPWFSPVPAIKKVAEGYLTPAGQSVLNPKYQYLAVVNPSMGLVGDASGIMPTTAIEFIDLNPLWDYADTLSWSHGKHAFRFGAELRLPRSAGNGSIQPYPTVTLGNNTSASQTLNPFSSSFTTELPNMLSSSIAPATVTNPRTQASNLLYYLNGSVNLATHQYWVTNQANLTSGNWSDYSTSGQRIRNQMFKEWTIFVKDDFKITRRLTLNLGARWEYQASPYYESGFTAAMIGYGYGAFGATRSAQSTLAQFQKDPFSLFMRPGNLYLANYGSLTGQLAGAAPLSCQTGVPQQTVSGQPMISMGSPVVSTCDPNSLSSIQFVGPGSPKPNITAEPVNYHNIGPAIGFAYSVPWFGDGKTTIRAGFQKTFGSAGHNGGAGPGGTEAEIGNAPGNSSASTTVASDQIFQPILNQRALNLSDIPTLIPVRPSSAPGQALPIYGRSAAPTVFDPHYQTPYTENVNFSITRQINRKFTLDMRYVGTFGRKQEGSIDINTNNVYHNPELLQALKDARAGTCTGGGYPNYTAQNINPCDIAGDPVILDQLFAGLSLVSGTSTDSAGVTRTFGAVGTVSGNLFQSGAQQLRKSSAISAGGTIQQSLSWGDFNSVANALLSLAPTGLQTAPNNPATGGALAGRAQLAMRNGCDRLANGFTIVQQTTAGGPQVASSGAAIPLRCFPEDWLTSNPQFSSITYQTNLGHTNYNSFQTSVTARPTNGISSQFTWTWAKSMYLAPSGYFDPSNRNANFTAQNINAHSFRMNGTFELPIGPNKLFLGNSSGWVGRALERWQTSVIFNAATGVPTTLTPGVSHCYVSCGLDIASPNWKNPRPHLGWYGASNGNIYALPSSSGSTIITPFTQTVDPSCSNPSLVSQGDKMGTNLGVQHANPVTGANIAAVCTISAVARRNPDGTPGETLLQFSAPGTPGNLGQNTVAGFGQWSLDMSASKSFRVAESKTFQMRIDATNVMNHPVPGTPSLAPSTFGAVTTKSNNRTFQGELRVSF
jgi:hypothetical protein